MTPWVFWVGLAVVSPVVGPSGGPWTRCAPSSGSSACVGGAGCPRRLGYLLAAAWPAGFVWLELVAPDRADPVVLVVLTCAALGRLLSG